MKLIGDGPLGFDLEKAIAQPVNGDYVYMYPPRQAYSTSAWRDLRSAIECSLASTDDQQLNLYVHFPFCRQICKFCNLYSVATIGSQFSDYVELVESELASWAKYTSQRTVDTVYLGGGTPSLLPPQDLDRVVTTIERLWSFDRTAVPEIALEVAPDTVDLKRLCELRSIGINRINLGLQTTSDRGLHAIGRRHGYEPARRSIDAALNAGFLNVCVDLIYGLPGQSLQDWESSLEDVLEFCPQTVCAYPLTLRPNTGFARHNLVLDGGEQYAKYDLALQLLTSRGYVQETHVRYSLPGGGYRQKRNHWAGQDIIGAGAGARGYLNSVDYRNGYSVINRRNALKSYAARVRQGIPAFDSGFVLDVDEQMRRAVILGLLYLDRQSFEQRFGVDVMRIFSGEICELHSLGLLDITPRSLMLTVRGRKYRDLVILRFFSETVWKRVAQFDYME